MMDGWMDGWMLSSPDFPERLSQIRLLRANPHKHAMFPSSCTTNTSEHPRVLLVVFFLTPGQIKLRFLHQRSPPVTALIMDKDYTRRSPTSFSSLSCTVGVLNSPANLILSKSEYSSPVSVILGILQSLFWEYGAQGASVHP